MRGAVTPTPQCQATRALGCDADDTVKSLQEDEKYIDLHMNVYVSFLLCHLRRSLGRAWLGIEGWGSPPPS